MKFALVDSILELDRGQRIIAVKAVSLAEEYLADHFPTFPVLPGVLMLEALTESAAWLVRDALDFSVNLVLLGEARNVTYKSFVKPGNLLRMEVTCRSLAPERSEFDGVGFCGTQEVVRAKFSLRHFYPAEHRTNAAAEQRILKATRERFDLIRPKRIETR